MVSQGLSTVKALEIAQMPRSTYYYKSTGQRKGKVPSQYTLYNGKKVDNADVVKTINSILEQEFIDYGYHRTTEVLKNMGYQINHKKVYRLMKENKLLFKPFKKNRIDKVFVRYNTPMCKRVFETLEIDIKYIYIHGLKKNAYLITLMDVFSRAALVWRIETKMKAGQAVALVNELNDSYLIPLGIEGNTLKIKIRSDNGSQFIAKIFRNILDNLHIENEYIKPATPQQNGHIESFHNTINRLVTNHYYFDGLDEARAVFSRFYNTYNKKRIMKSILNKTPMDFIKAWANNGIEIKKINGKIKYFFREKSPQFVEGPYSEICYLQNKINDNFNVFLNHY
ncbi:MAG: IS3 family transposase [Chlorobi bacterium]|nr:IS3 family transposase [Chlorobiota bacterium]